jgi:hypothetical protein
MKKVLICFAFVTIIVNIGKAQDDCKVLLEAISGSYEGECKKGLANGEGTAKGIDSYTGEFKKGLPDGEGVYTWANGNVYDGEFKKGQKEGEGTMKTKQENGEFIEKVGFWKDDEYIGEYQNPYKVQYKSAGVQSIRIVEMENPDNDGDALFIEFQHRGRTQPFPNYELNLINGNLYSRLPFGNMSKILVAQFPFGFTLRYMDESVELQVYQARTWKVTLDFNK